MQLNQDVSIDQMTDCFEELDNMHELALYLFKEANKYFQKLDFHSGAIYMDIAQRVRQAKEKRRDELHPMIVEITQQILH